MGMQEPSLPCVSLHLTVWACRGCAAGSRTYKKLAFVLIDATEAKGFFAFTWIAICSLESSLWRQPQNLQNLLDKSYPLMETKDTVLIDVAPIS